MNLKHQGHIFHAVSFKHNFYLISDHLISDKYLTIKQHNICYHMQYRYKILQNKNKAQ